MSDLSFRPRFRFSTSLSCEEVEKLILQKLKENNPDGYESSIVQGHFILRISEKKRHFWSPQMDISVRPDDDTGETVVRCLLAPAPVVWTMFMFFYALTGFGALVGLMIASSQYSLDKEMWGFWLAGGSVVAGLLLFIFAQFGKSLSEDEMKQMKAFISEMDIPPIPEKSQEKKLVV